MPLKEAGVAVELRVVRTNVEKESADRTIEQVVDHDRLVQLALLCAQHVQHDCASLEKLEIEAIDQPTTGLPDGLQKANGWRR